ISELSNDQRKATSKQPPLKGSKHKKLVFQARFQKVTSRIDGFQDSTIDAVSWEIPCNQVETFLLQPKLFSFPSYFYLDFLSFEFLADRALAIILEGGDFGLSCLGL
ncbi:hypothetical protein O6P43_035485, partial [Quillaja saponaria]